MTGFFGFLTAVGGMWLTWHFTARRYRRQIAAWRIENYTLRDALRNNNAELVKHRNLINALKDGDTVTTDRLMKAMKGSK